MAHPEWHFEYYAWSGGGRRDRTLCGSAPHRSGSTASGVEAVGVVPTRLSRQNLVAAAASVVWMAPESGHRPHDPGQYRSAESASLELSNPQSPPPATVVTAAAQLPAQHRSVRGWVADPDGHAYHRSLCARCWPCLLQAPVAAAKQTSQRRFLLSPGRVPSADRACFPVEKPNRDGRQTSGHHR